MEPAQVEARPPALIESLAAWLVPPAACEHVMGDLHERYTTPARYLRDVVAIAPRLVLRQVWRVVNADFGLYAAEIAGFATVAAGRNAFVPDAWWTSVPSAVIFCVLMLRDAYVDTSTRPDTLDSRSAAFEAALIGSAKDALLAIACAWLVQVTVVPAVHRAPSAAVFDVNAYCFLMFGAMRAAWWTLYVPGARRSRFRRARPASASGEHDAARYLSWGKRRLIAVQWVVFVAIGALVAPIIFGPPRAHVVARLVFSVCAIAALGDVAQRARARAEDELG
jgi:hypothetical protein